MCVEPTTALLIASVASAGMQYQSTVAQQKATQQAQQRQNELAQRNAANLTAKMEEVNEAKNLTRKTPSAAEVEKWIAQAKELPRVIEY